MVGGHQPNFVAYQFVVIDYSRLEASIRYFEVDSQDSNTKEVEVADLTGDLSSFGAEADTAVGSEVADSETKDG